MRKTILILTVALLGAAAWADEPPPPPHENSKMQSERTGQRRQRQMRDFFGSLSEKERQELRTLQETNPEEYKKTLSEWLEKYNRKVLEREKFIRDQIQIYQTAESQEDRDKAYAEVKRITVEDFERNMKEHRQLLDFLENKLKVERERYEMRQKNASAIIKARLDELTKPPELRW
jgi:hypothetical protein